MTPLSASIGVHPFEQCGEFTQGSMEDPNAGEAPDYTADEFQEERQTLIEAGLNPQTAVSLLTRLWNIKNKRRDATQQRRQDAPDAHLPLQHEPKDLLDLFKDEWNSQNLRLAKVASFVRQPTSLEPSVLPALAATCMLKGYRFCELWYFTNAGLDEADRSKANIIDTSSLHAVKQQDSTLGLLPSAFFAGKSGLVNDEDLSFEQFTQATYRMAMAMHDCGWQKRHVDMHIRLWSNITNHAWRQSRVAGQQRALLAYQENQRRQWHMTRGAFDLAVIDDKVLSYTYKCINIEAYYNSLAKMTLGGLSQVPENTTTGASASASPSIVPLSYANKRAASPPASDLGSTQKKKKRRRRCQSSLSSRRVPSKSEQPSTPSGPASGVRAFESLPARPVDAVVVQ